MDYLSKDIVYECIGYLHWKEYYDVCELFGITLEIKRYCHNYTFDRDDMYRMCECNDKYIELIRYLYENKYELIKYNIASCTELAIEDENLVLLKMLEDDIKSFVIVRAIEYGKLHILKYLHEELNMELLDELNYYLSIRIVIYEYFDVFVYLHNNKVDYDREYIIKISKMNQKHKFIKFLESN